MKRWNPAKDVDGKTDRPVCEQLPQHGARCLQSCRNLIVESNGMHGCLELDFKEKMVRLADHIMSISKPLYEPNEAAPSDTAATAPPPPPYESTTEPPDTPDDMIPIDKQEDGKPSLAPGQTVGDLPPPAGKPSSLSPTGKRGPGKPGKGK